MRHHTMCATTVERMGMEMADTGNNDDEQQWIATMLERLSHSQFRAKFALTDKDRAYARTKGKATIDRHAREMLRDRIGAAEPKNDGSRRHGAAIRYSPLSMPPPHAVADASKNGIICPKAVNSPKRR